MQILAFAMCQICTTVVSSSSKCWPTSAFLTIKTTMFLSLKSPQLIVKDLSKAMQWIKSAPERKHCPTDLYFPLLTVFLLLYGSVSETHNIRIAARNFYLTNGICFQSGNDTTCKGDWRICNFPNNFTCAANSSKLLIYHQSQLMQKYTSG